MTTALSIAALSALAALLAWGAWRYVALSYRDFCRRADQAERISALRKALVSARAYVRETYGDPFDTSVRDNITTKVDFLERLILRRAPDVQERELKLLVGLLAETFLRLRTDYDDVRGITAPLNSLRDRLVSEHLQYLKDHMPEETA